MIFKERVEEANRIASQEIKAIDQNIKDKHNYHDDNKDN